MRGRDGKGMWNGMGVWMVMGEVKKVECGLVRS